MTGPCKNWCASGRWINCVLILQVSIGSTTGGSNSQTVTDLSHDIQETVEQVLAGITGTIRSGAQDGCSIDVINEAQVQIQGLRRLAGVLCCTASTRPSRSHLRC